MDLGVSLGQLPLRFFFCNPLKPKGAGKQCCVCLGVGKNMDTCEHEANLASLGRPWFCTKLNSFALCAYGLVKGPSLLCDIVTLFQPWNGSTSGKFHSQPGYTVFRHNPPGSFPYYHLYADEHRDPRCHMLKMDQTQDGKNLDPWVTSQREAVTVRDTHYVH